MMAVDLGLLSARIGADVTGLSKAQRDAQGMTSRIQRDLDGTRKAATMLGSAFAALGVGLSFRSIIDATSDAQVAMAQLEAGVKSTGGAAGYSAQELATMAGEMQKLTRYEDESVMRAQAVLLTFTKIGKETFPQATMAAANMATRMGGDLNGAILQVGKALHDPIRGVMALRRAGVQLSGQQQAQIESFMAVNDVASAQQIILKELETQFGGSAAAARNTLGGALDGIKNAFGDLLEAPGGMNDTISSLGRIEEKLRSDAWRQAAGQITSFAVNSVGLLADNLDLVAAAGAVLVTRTLGPMAAGMVTAASASVQLALAHGAEAQAAAKAAVADEAAALAALNAAKSRAALVGSTEAVTVAQAAYTAAQARATAATVAAGTAAKAASVSVGILRGALALVGGPGGAALLAAGALYYFAGSSRRAAEDAETARNAVAALNEELYTHNWNQSQKDALEYSKKIMDASDSVGELKKQLSQLESVQQPDLSLDDMRGMGSGSAEIEAKRAEAIMQVKEQIQAEESHIQTYKQYQKEALSAAQAQKQNADATKGNSAATREATAINSSYIKGLQEQVGIQALQYEGDELGIELLKNKNQYEEQAIKLAEEKGIAIADARKQLEPELRDAETLLWMIDSQKQAIDARTESEKAHEAQLQKTASAAESVRSAIATPQDEYNSKLREAESLYKSGAISQDELTRAKAAYAQQLDQSIVKEENAAASLAASSGAARQYAADLDFQRTVAQATMSGNLELVKSLEAQQVVTQALGEEATPALVDQLTQLTLATNQATQAASEYNALIEQGVSIFEQSKTQAQQQAEQISAVDAAFKASKLNADEYDQALDHVKNQGKAVADASQQMSQAITGAFADAIMEGKDFQGVLQGLLQDLARVAMQQAIFAPFEGWLGGMFGGLGGMFGASHGMALNTDGGALPFASGGIVNSPQTFPMRGGTGLMGEAGPEAILPLTRNSRGDLGVVSTGGGGTTEVIVQIIDQRKSGQAVGMKETTDADGRRVVQALIRDEVSRELQPGGKFANQIQANFGLRERPVRR